MENSDSFFNKLSFSFCPIAGAAIAVNVVVMVNEYDCFFFFFKKIYSHCAFIAHKNEKKKKKTRRFCFCFFQKVKQKEIETLTEQILFHILFINHYYLCNIIRLTASNNWQMLLLLPTHPVLWPLSRESNARNMYTTYRFYFTLS